MTYLIVDGVKYHRLDGDEARVFLLDNMIINIIKANNYLEVVSPSFFVIDNITELLNILMTSRNIGNNTLGDAEPVYRVERCRIAIPCYNVSPSLIEDEKHWAIAEYKRKIRSFNVIYLSEDDLDKNDINTYFVC